MRERQGKGNREEEREREREAKDVVSFFHLLAYFPQTDLSCSIHKEKRGFYFEVLIKKQPHSLSCHPSDTFLRGHLF